MKRLTARNNLGYAFSPKCLVSCNGVCCICEHGSDVCERLAAYEDTGLEPKDIPTALEMCKIKLGLDNLKEYQNTGLAPDQILQMDKLYRKKCGELAELRKEVYGYTE